MTIGGGGGGGVRRVAAITCAVAMVASCGTRRDLAELESAARTPIGSSIGEVASSPASVDPDHPDQQSEAVQDLGSTGDLVVGGSAGPGDHDAAPGRSGGTTPGGGTTGVGSTCAPKCSPLIIGSVGTYSGLVGQNVGPGVRALQAWASFVNAKGGLGGHEVKVIVADDGGDPARHRSLLQELVDDRGVVAFVYNAAPLSGQASIDYIRQKQIPVIGSEAAGDWFYSSPFFFPQSSSGKLIGSAGLAAAASSRPAGEDKLGLIYCTEGISICEIARSSTGAAAKGTGWNLVYSGSGSLAQPDFTANCLAARDAGAQAIVLAMDGNSAVRIARLCASIGYKPKLILNQQIEFQYLAADPLLQGSYATGLNAPWFDSSNAGVAEFRAAMAQYAPDVELAGAPIQGWTSAKLLEAAGSSITEPPTSESVLAGLYALRGDTLGGLAPPLTFTRGEVAPRYVCYWPLIIRDNDYRNSRDGSLECIDVPAGVL